MVFIKPAAIPRHIQEELDAMDRAAKRILATRESAAAFLSSVRVHPRKRARPAAKKS